MLQHYQRTLRCQILVQSHLFFWEEKSYLHKLIRTYTFIDFEDFSYLHVILYYMFISHVYFFARKNPSCTSLLGPTRLLILRIFPTYTFIQACTSIWQPRVCMPLYFCIIYFVVKSIEGGKEIK